MGGFEARKRIVTDEGGDKKKKAKQIIDANGCFNLRAEVVKLSLTATIRME